MPYPTDSPTMKHDLLGVYPVNHENELISKNVFNDWESLSNALEHFKTSKCLICHNYSYSDGPKEPICKLLEIVGFISLNNLR